MNYVYEPGQTLPSPGKNFNYVINGPVCPLYDRELLPYPCCRLLWHSKEPFWNRIGRRFVPDIGAKHFPSYSLQLVDENSEKSKPYVMTLFWLGKLEAELQNWWYTKRFQAVESQEKADRYLSHEAA